MLIKRSHLSEGDKNTDMNFTYHTEFVSQHVDHFKTIKDFEKKVGQKISHFPQRGRSSGVGWGVTPSWKIPRNYSI